MQNALEMAGFEQLRFYGNLKGEAFDPAQSGDLIVVARKAK
jgi:hypothetical protein